MTVKRFFWQFRWHSKLFPSWEKWAPVGINYLFLECKTNQNTKARISHLWLLGGVYVSNSDESFHIIRVYAWVRWNPTWVFCNFSSSKKCFQMSRYLFILSKNLFCLPITDTRYIVIIIIIPQQMPTHCLDLITYPWWHDSHNVIALAVPVHAHNFCFCDYCFI